MQASLGYRNEYASYFIRIGDRVLNGASTELNKARLRMGIHGYVADGLLFRVSEITSDRKNAYALQDAFVYDLLAAVEPDKLIAFIPN